MPQVCPVESDWVGKFVANLRGVNVERLSGGATTARVLAAPGSSTENTSANTADATAMAAAGRTRTNQAALQAAKARFAARKAATARAK